MAYRGACHFLFMLLLESDGCIDWLHARLNCLTFVVIIPAFANELVAQQCGIGRGTFLQRGFYADKDYCQKWSLHYSS